MTRQMFPALVAFLLTVVAFAAAGGPAFAASPHYRAEPVTASAAERLVVRDLMWHCSGGACVAGRNHSRPAIICAALVREVGPLRSFSVAGSPLAAGELEKCNARAR
jgi:hypothetical protein